MVGAAVCLLILSCAAVPLQAESRFGSGDQSASRAVNLLSSGNLEACESSAKEALHAYDELLGPAHPHTALARRNWAVALWHLGKIKEAEIEMLQARAALVVAEGESGPNSLRVTMDLAQLYLEDARQAEAAALFERTWQLATAVEQKREAALATMALQGPGHENKIQNALADARISATAETALSISLWEGEIYLKLQSPARAIKAFGMAHELGKKFYGEGHPLMAPSYEGMGRSLSALGQKSEAEPFFERALEGRKRMAGMLNYSSLAQHEALGRLLRDMGRIKEARDEFKEILALRKKLQPGHPAIKQVEKLISSLKS